MLFQIPKEDIPAIKALEAMPNASVEAFLKALKSVSPSADTDEIAKQITEQVPSIPTKELEAVLDTLYGLYFIREVSGVKRETFLDDFIEGIQNEPELTVDGKDVPRIRTKFEKLFNIEAFTLLSKAKRLQRDGERLYCDAKILSDVRPVFGIKPTVRPTGAVITHTLKIGYHERGDHKDFNVVLDSIDLVELSDVIDRAFMKDKTLRALLKDAKLADLGL